jgi:hypothetical protein
MRAIGFLLLCAGFAIALSAAIVLADGAPRAAFVLAGVVVQLLGLFLTFRAHFILDEEH